MGDPWGIVVVPTEAGAALSADGPCGGRAPYVGKYRYRENGVVKWSGWAAPSRPTGITRDALPLWWAGALIPEGWDRARRVALEHSEDDGSEGRDLCTGPWLAARDVATAASWMAAKGLCRVVLLDLVDGVVVERAT